MNLKFYSKNSSNPEFRKNDLTSNPKGNKFLKIGEKPKKPEQPRLFGFYKAINLNYFC
jgi:hypothetical protein